MFSFLYMREKQLISRCKMKVEMYDKNGLIIKTKEKFCTEDIEVIPSFPTESGNNLQLYPPNVSVVDQDFAIVEDPDNGLFATSWRLYANERLIDNNVVKGSRIDLTAFFGENGDFTLQAKSFSERFLPSIFSEPVLYIRVVYTEGLSYRIIDNSNFLYACSGIGTATGPYIAIANTYSGNPVVAVFASAFEGNTDITNVYIPEGIEDIQSKAFYACYALKSVTLPSTLDFISSDAFAMPLPYANSLSRVNFLGTADQWAQIVNYSNLLQYADLYINGRKTTDIVLTNAITSIGRGAFSYFEGNSITIPDSVTSIEVDAFAYCTATIIWGGTPTIDNIPISAFANYAGNSITIPNTVYMVNNGAFSSAKITSITIPASVGEIRVQAFYKCVDLTSLVFAHKIVTDPYGDYTGDLLSYIREESFMRCSSLKSIVFPLRVGDIETRAFASCVALEIVKFGNVTNIEDEVFLGDLNLKLVDFRLAKKIPNLKGTNVFTVSNYKIVVPDNLYDEWILAENWSTYADHIVKASEYVEP